MNLAALRTRHIYLFPIQTEIIDFRTGGRIIGSSEQSIQNRITAAFRRFDPDPSTEQILCYVDIIHRGGKDPLSIVS